MDCNRYHKHVADEQPPNGESRAHEAMCDACAAIADDHGVVARSLLSIKDVEHEPAYDVEHSLRSMRALINREQTALGWLRARSTLARASMVSVVLLGSVAAMYLRTQRVPFVELSAHFALFLLAIHVFFRSLAKPVLARTRAWTIAGALSLPPVFALWVHASSTPHDDCKPILPCFLIGAGMALPFLFLLIALDRRSTMNAERSWLAGCVAGVCANALLHLQCLSTGLGHLVLGHGALALLVGAGAWGLTRLRTPACFGE